MLMALTNQGSQRIDQIVSDALVFVLSHVAYGTEGYDLNDPSSPSALNPAATSLGNEVFRKKIPWKNHVLNESRVRFEVQPIPPQVFQIPEAIFSIPINVTPLTPTFIVKGRETTYTTLGGDEFAGVIGEAGLIGTVISPGTTGLDPGYQFLVAHAHFGRVVLTPYDRLSIAFPIEYAP